MKLREAIKQTFLTSKLKRCLPEDKIEQDNIPRTRRKYARRSRKQHFCYKEGSKPILHTYKGNRRSELNREPAGSLI